MLSSRPAALAMDGQAFPTKTPGRVKGRAENAVPTTVHGKGKDIALRTPFHAQKGHNIQTQGKQIILATRPGTRPLGDKTPFPNRARKEHFETPAPKLVKFPVLSFFEQQTTNKTPDSQLRPSSARKHTRAPKSASKNFETPANNGNHWDVSDISIVMPEAAIQESTPEDDYDEIEYMAPNNLGMIPRSLPFVRKLTDNPKDLPYQPPFDFDLPNYKEVGKKLWDLMHSCPYDDPPMLDIDIDPEDVPLSTLHTLPVIEIESDDPFHEIPLAPATQKPSLPASGARAPVKPVGVPPKAIPTSRSGTITRIPSSTTTRSTTTRAGISQSVVPSTKPTVKANVLSKVPSTTRVTPQVQAPRTRTSKPSVNAAATVPRPATATATRSRATSTAIASAAFKRPATSTSSYKTTNGAPLRTISGKAAIPLGKQRPATTAKTEPNDALILVDEGMDLLDDFRFEV
ncbi:hypothetical protein H0H81_001220 [Sphagnurus paluster]|uniref:Uncharacterized protein n=1 Tax=Sphagnurus paluster TaxID=117069 RepID=A0A9P7K6K4_9AGAR|nr:hypothetical protein H0H81_001220 [Sphagnurus paluster]